VQLEHVGSGGGFRQRDVDTLLKPTPDGRVQHPGDVGRSQD